MLWKKIIQKRGAAIAFMFAIVGTAAEAQVVPDFPFYPSNERLDEILNDFPTDITSVRNLGENLGNDVEPLKALIISDNPTQIEDEPVVLLTGVIHGREPLGLRAVLGLADNLVSNYASDATIRKIVDSYQIVIVPVMNRWGYANRLRKNAPSTDNRITSGVDLNRNGKFGWDRCDNNSRADLDGENGPDCYEPIKGTFHGPVPNSEYETETMQALVDWLKPLFGVVFHSGTGGTRGQIFYPYSTSDSGDDRIFGTGDDHRLEPLKDIFVGMGMATSMARSVLESREEGYFCSDSPAAPPGSCSAPASGRTGSAGATGANYYALTGMIELLVETHAPTFIDNMGVLRQNAWVSNYMYEDRQELRPDRQARLDLGREYARNYADGLQGLLENAMCEDGPSPSSFKGPGFTGRVLDQTGRPIVATIKVLQLDNSLHGDYIDANQDPGNRRWVPYGEQDYRYRKTQADTGRFYRLLPLGPDSGRSDEYTIEISAESMVTQTITLTEPGSSGCLDDLGDILMEPVLDDHAGICSVAPQLTGITNGSVLPQGSTSIEWTSNGCHFWVWMGDAPDRNNYHNESMAGKNSVIVNGYPADGSEVHLTLFYRNTNIVQAPWNRAYFSFQAPADTQCVEPPTLISHQSGETLALGGDTISWTSNGCHFWVWAGDSPDKNNYHNESMAGRTSITIDGYPADGGEVHLTLFYRNTNNIGAPWNREYFSFNAPTN